MKFKICEVQIIDAMTELTSLELSQTNQSKMPVNLEWEVSFDNENKVEGTYSRQARLSVYDAKYITGRITNLIPRSFTDQNNT